MQVMQVLSELEADSSLSIRIRGESEHLLERRVSLRLINRPLEDCLWALFGESGYAVTMYVTEDGSAIVDVHVGSSDVGIAADMEEYYQSALGRGTLAMIEYYEPVSPQVIAAVAALDEEFIGEQRFSRIGAIHFESIPSNLWDLVTQDGDIAGHAWPDQNGASASSHDEPLSAEVVVALDWLDGSLAHSAHPVEWLDFGNYESLDVAIPSDPEADEPVSLAFSDNLVPIEPEILDLLKYMED